MHPTDILHALGLEEKNSGGYFGVDNWSSTTDLGELISINPATEQAIARTHRVSLADYDRACDASKNAFLTWRMVPAPKRGELIRQIGDALRTHRHLLGQLVSLEMGKSLREGIGEVQEMIDMADMAVGQARMLYGCTMQSERHQHRMYEHWHPLGVVAVITAFNFPVAVWAWNAFLAIVCGNTVIWKPSPKTSLCAIAVMHLCNQVMKNFGCNGVFSLLCSDDPHLVETMAEDTRIALLSFTGSTRVGREINALAAQRFARVILELSGNNAIILDESADLRLAIPSIVFGAVGTAGQRCTTTRRLFVHHSIYDQVVSALQKRYKTITVGDPLDETQFMGPLIDAAAVAHFSQAVSDAVALGGTVLHGGKTVKRKGFFVEPTLIAAKNAWEVVQRETFAPILYVMSYNSLDDALSLHNHSRFGLSSALFTENVRHSEYFLSALGSDCGIANINLGTSGAEIGGAFGGEKETGGGREAGSDVWKNYMRRQTSTINWSGQLNLAQGITLE